MHKNDITYKEDEDLIEQWIEEYGEDVLRTAYFFVKDYSASEDIFQEVFLKVYKNIRKFRGESSIKTWIIKITINQCKDYLKSGWAKRILLNFGLLDSQKDAVANTSLDKYLTLSEERQKLLNSITSLPLKSREVLVLRYFNGFNENEIASLYSILQRAPYEVGYTGQRLR
ncbi:MAG TPA: sigma-70 family RNA polymerase sigma factor [Acetivibrio sp.]|uniref:sigma-70 family RNA polymerase sigma factor n=1 Tax=Acetivibrio sp. TaxID=1872092 RepID=UPI002CE6D4E7|nr:sigma-70 family RNA polymerase sigma factor [Acetivibrio sp.]HOM01934.1 sigma-70 family RNA polymerase sigma factor [Acetivibrio sp.]